MKRMPLAKVLVPGAVLLAVALAARSVIIAAPAPVTPTKPAPALAAVHRPRPPAGPALRATPNELAATVAVLFLGAQPRGAR